MTEGPQVLHRCVGGTIILPAAGLVLVDRADGGNLVVNPPRAVWERSCLGKDELIAWSCLVAATGQAMIDALPQLDGGCVNYWEAGNWALNDAADPHGPKTAPDNRQVHMHLLGRSRDAASADWRWGEAPRFPRYAERLEWSAKHERLTEAECTAVVQRARDVLCDKYGIA